jgi:putative endonuclease
MPRARVPALYILASRRNGTLYVGVTSNLVARTWQHRHHANEGFTTKYRVHRLVYFELHGSMSGAIQREKRIKRWTRAWKVALIEKDNPQWRDLWSEIAGRSRSATPS